MSDFDDAVRILVDPEALGERPPDEAQAYLRDLWTRARCDELLFPVAFAVFDAAVASGVRTAVQLLQRALQVTDDGRFGPVTLAAAHAAEPAALAARIYGHRLVHMTRKKDWEENHKDWAGRVGKRLSEVGP